MLRVRRRTNLLFTRVPVVRFLVYRHRRLPSACNGPARSLVAPIVLICLVTATSCSGGVKASGATQLEHTLVSRAAPNSHVLLVPEIVGGTAGWCMATATNSDGEEGSSGCGTSRTSSGPIMAESCTGKAGRMDVYALTLPEVAAVSFASGAPIPTEANVTLPNRLRAVAVEVLGYTGRPKSPSEVCPQLTALDTRGNRIVRRSTPGTPLIRRVPVDEWEMPTMSTRGICRLMASQAPPDTVATDGDVALRIGSFRGLLGRAFFACADTTYVYREEHHLRSAILLNAVHPGATPAPLPGMRPIASRPGLFEAPGVNGVRVARRLPGAWIVVEEVDNIGLRVPIELVDHLRATISL
jgi:hypothetical protein